MKTKTIDRFQSIYLVFYQAIRLRYVHPLVCRTLNLSENIFRLLKYLNIKTFFFFYIAVEISKTIATLNF